MTGYVRINDFIKLSPKSLRNLLSRVNRVYRDFVPESTRTLSTLGRWIYFFEIFLHSSK